MVDNTRVFNIDCLPAMREFPDKYFELAIVDPPYGIGDFRNTSSKEIHSKIEWNNEIPTAEYFIELTRITKNRIIWGCNYYGKFIDDVGIIVHDKTGGGKRPVPAELSSCDIASHSFGVNMKIFHYSHMGNWIDGKIDWNGTERIHPCQKPTGLYKWLLKNYAKEGDKILDTHLGSGSSRIAAFDMGFNFTGYELDSDYFNAAEKRFQQHKSQLKLFI